MGPSLTTTQQARRYAMVNEAHYQSNPKLTAECRHILPEGLPCLLPCDDTGYCTHHAPHR